MAVDEEAVRWAKLAVSRLPKGDDLTFRGVPIAEFDAPELTKILAMSQRELDQERRFHDKSVGLLSALSRCKFGGRA